MTRSCSIANRSWLYARIASSAVTCRARCISCSPATRATRAASSAFPSLKLKIVCRISAAVVKALRRNRRQGLAKLRRERVESRAVQESRVARAPGEGVPRDIGKRVGFRFDNAAFEQSDLFEAQLHGGVCRQRLRNRVCSRKRLRRCDVVKQDACEKRECRSHSAASHCHPLKIVSTISSASSGVSSGFPAMTNPVAASLIDPIRMSIRAAVGPGADFSARNRFLRRGCQHTNHAVIELRAALCLR